ncbi:hypothetical protein ABZ172_22740 [Streptomyces sp. NPDC006296]|uniref:hypothetical protein n=1 Tax=Streptomyces sp. NPDC006296 TaxID=3156746 RepID=UPI0033A449F2
MRLGACWGQRLGDVVEPLAGLTRFPGPCDSPPDTSPLHIVVLAPGAAVARRRNQAREKALATIAQTGRSQQ